MASSVGDLTIDVSTNTASVEVGFNRLADLIGRQTGQIERSVDGVQGRLTALGDTFVRLAQITVAGIGLHAFEGMIQGAIEAQAHLQDVADKIGSTASALSSLVPAAKLSGTSIDEIAQVTNKFSKTLLDVQAGTGKAAKAFEALGFNAQDAGRFLQNPTQGLLELSKRTQEFANDGNLAAVRMELMGKNAAALAPFMKQLAEQTELTATVTDRQAQAAKRLQDEWTTLTLRGDALKNVIASAIVPELTRLVEGFGRATSASGGFRDKVTELAGDGTLAIWVHNLALALAILGETLIVIGRSLYAFAGSVRVVYNDIAATPLAQSLADRLGVGGEFRKALESRDSDLADSNNRWSKLWNDNATALSDSLRKELGDMEAFRVAAQKQVIASANAVRDAAANQGERFLPGVIAGGYKPRVDTSGITDNAKTKVDEFAAAIQRFRQQAAEANAEWTQLLDGKKITAAQKAFEALKESDVWSKFTAGQRLAIEQMADIASGLQSEVELQTRLKAVIDQVQDSALGFTKDWTTQFGTLTEAFNAGIITLENYRRLTEQLLNQQPFARKQAEAMQALIKLEEEAIRDLQKLQDEATKAIGAYADQNTRLAEENALIGQSEEARAKALVLLDAQASRQLLINAGDVEGLRILDEQIAKRQNLVVQQIELNKASNALVDIFKSVADRGAQFITDFVTHGSSAFKRLWDDFKTWALSALAQIAAKQLVVSVVGSLGLGSAATAAANGLSGGPLGSLGGAGNLLSGANTILGGGDAVLGTAFSAIGIDLASTGASLATLGIAAEAGAAAVGGLGAVAVAAIPVVGWIAAIALAAYAIFGGKGGGPKSGGFATGGVDLATLAPTPGIPGDRLFTPADADATVQKIVDSISKTYAQIANSFGLKVGQAAFALGFDTDPAGKAGSRVSVGATVDGSSVYARRDIDVGRDNADLQARLGLEAQRALLAALQASSLPEYLAKLLDSVDVASASADQITGIIATAQALKLAVDVIGQLGPALANLDPANVQAFVASFGGLDGFLKSFQFLNANFLTGAEQKAKQLEALDKAFTNLGVELPKTHQGFLDLLNSLDLNDEGGRKLYASLVQLAPAFIQVNGTAEAAADALQKQAEANQKVIDSSTKFFESNFYSDVEKAAKSISDAQAEIQSANEKIGGGISIPTTLAGFRALIESLEKMGDAGKPLLAILLPLAPAVFTLNTALNGTAAAAAAASTALTTYGGLIGSSTIDKTAAGVATKFLTQLNTAIDAGLGDFGTKLGQKVNAIGAQIAAVTLQRDTDPSIVENRFDRQAKQEFYDTELATLSATNTKLASELGRFTVLSAQYDAAKAEQLVGLEQWYNDQKFAMRGNTIALAALQVTFNEKWQAIITGVAAAAQSLDAFIASIKKLADATGGNAGQRAGIELALSNAKLQQLQTSYAGLQPGDPGAAAIQAQIKLLETYNTGFAKQIANFTIYTAQFGAAAASQLVDLENWYADQQNALAGNTDALTILAAIFDDKWKAIIDGISTGVNGSLAELEKLRQGIADYLKGLQVSDLSPLTPLEKLNQGKTAYDQELSLAQGGDTKALGDITQFADTYLKLSRDFYASSSAYTDIFSAVTAQLGTLAGTSPTGERVAVDPTFTNIAAALPTGSTLTSQADTLKQTAALIAALNEAIAALANAGAQDTTVVTTQLQTTTNQIVNATAPALK